MANLIEKAKEQINEILIKAYEKSVENGQLPAGAELKGTVEIPKATQNGDYAANHAMTGAKALRMAPRKIAEALAENAELDGTWFTSIEVAGPGFINFRLSDKWYADVMTAVNNEGLDYGRVNVGESRKLMV
ncbi:protein containing Arginyl tRNA synthetase, class Ic, partial [gut metagenome]